jgi:hypothetical protein
MRGFTYSHNGPDQLSSQDAALMSRMSLTDLRLDGDDVPPPAFSRQSAPSLTRQKSIGGVKKAKFRIFTDTSRRWKR